MTTKAEFGVTQLCKLRKPEMGGNGELRRDQSNSFRELSEEASPYHTLFSDFQSSKV